MDINVKQYYQAIQNNIYKNVLNYIEKGRKGFPAGTIRVWKGKRYEKQVSSKWKYIGKQKEHAKSFDEYYNFHAEYQDKFKEYINNLSERYNADTVVAPPKNKKRSQEKIDNEYKGDYTKLKDILRSTLVVQNKEDARKIYDDIIESKTLVKNAFDFDNDGYQSANVVFELDGRNVEVQINTPYNLALKDNNDLGNPAIRRNIEILKDAGIKPGQGHKYYESLRNLKKDTQRYQNVYKEMIQYYTEGRKTLKSLE